MATDNNIVVVKIHRNQVGNVIPYDKLYFFNYDNRYLIPKIFNYALVLPVEDDLLNTISTLVPREVSHFKQHRDDNAVKQLPRLQSNEVPDGRIHSKKTIAAWWQENFFDRYAIKSRVAVVPILTSIMRKKIIPRYLTAARWFNTSKTPPPRVKTRSRRLRAVQPPRSPVGGIDKPAISELAYLATPHPAPNDKIRPICTVCPRMLLHMQGECIPGQLICYKSLDFKKITEVMPVEPYMPETDTHASL